MILFHYHVESSLNRTIVSKTLRISFTIYRDKRMCKEGLQVLRAIYSTISSKGLKVWFVSSKKKTTPLISKGNRSRYSVQEGNSILESVQRLQKIAKREDKQIQYTATKSCITTRMWQFYTISQMIIKRQSSTNNSSPRARPAFF